MSHNRTLLRAASLALPLALCAPTVLFAQTGYGNAEAYHFTTFGQIDKYGSLKQAQKGDAQDIITSVGFDNLPVSVVGGNLGSTPSLQITASLEHPSTNRPERNFPDPPLGASQSLEAGSGIQTMSLGFSNNFTEYIISATGSAYLGELWFGLNPEMISGSWYDFSLNLVLTVKDDPLYPLWNTPGACGVFDLDPAYDCISGKNMQQVLASGLNGYFEGIFVGEDGFVYRSSYTISPMNSTDPRKRPFGKLVAVHDAGEWPPLTTEVVPEPATVLLTAAGLAGLFAAARRRR